MGMARVEADEQKRTSIVDIERKTKNNRKRIMVVESRLIY